MLMGIHICKKIIRFLKPLFVFTVTALFVCAANVRRQKFKILFLMACSVLMGCAVKMFIDTIEDYLIYQATVPQLLATAMFVIMAGWACIGCFINIFDRRK
jgi:hypothetical protein